MLIRAFLFVALIALCNVCNCELSHSFETYSDEYYDMIPCIKSYLGPKGLLDMEFYSGPQTDVSLEPTCEEKLHSFENMFYIKLSDKIISDKNIKPDFYCVSYEMKKSKAADLALKLKFYKQSNATKSEILARQVESKIQSIKEAAFVLCTSDNAFGILFDNLYSEPLDHTVIFECIKKHFIKNNLLVGIDGGAHLESDKFDTSDAECKLLIGSSQRGIGKKFQKEYVAKMHQPSDERRQCVAAAIQESSFYEHFMRVSVLKAVEVSEEKKAEERVRFVDNMEIVNSNALKC